MSHASPKSTYLHFQHINTNYIDLILLALLILLHYMLLSALIFQSVYYKGYVTRCVLQSYNDMKMVMATLLVIGSITHIMELRYYDISIMELRC